MNSSEPYFGLLCAIVTCGVVRELSYLNTACEPILVTHVRPTTRQVARYAIEETTILLRESYRT